MARLGQDYHQRSSHGWIGSPLGAEAGRNPMCEDSPVVVRQSGGKGGSMSEAHVASVAMMIRKPVAEVYEAFVNPEITSKFWFTEGSARLDAGVPVRWTWAMYGYEAEATVDELVPNERIVVTWGGPERPTQVT